MVTGWHIINSTTNLTKALSLLKSGTEFLQASRRLLYSMYINILLLRQLFLTWLLCALSWKNIRCQWKWSENVRFEMKRPHTNVCIVSVNGKWIEYIYKILHTHTHLFVSTPETYWQQLKYSYVLQYFFIFVNSFILNAIWMKLKKFGPSA